MKRLLTLFSILVVLVLAACGGSSNEESTDENAGHWCVQYLYVSRLPACMWFTFSRSLLGPVHGAVPANVYPQQCFFNEVLA